MSREDRVREFEERLRHLCAQMVIAEGVDFEIALLELANALTLWQSSRDNQDDEQAVKAG